MKRSTGLITNVGLALIIVLSLISTVTGAALGAEKFPSREIVIVVPYPAGGSTDLTTRVFAEYFRREIGVPVIIENIAEAGGVKGVVDVYKGKPDGYMLLANLFPRTASTEVTYKVPYKGLELTYIIAFQKNYQFVSVNKDSPYKTLKDLAEAAKRKPINCATPGQGSASHLKAILLKKKGGIEFEAVAFQGSAASAMALIGGNVDLTILDDTQVRNNPGQFRNLAIFSEERSKRYPDVPTLKELGYDIPLLTSIQGISGPPGIPEEIQKILADASARATKNPDFIAAIEKMGADCFSISGPEFRAIAKTVYDDLKKIMQDYGDIIQGKGK